MNSRLVIVIIKREQYLRPSDKNNYQGDTDGYQNRNYKKLNRNSLQG